MNIIDEYGAILIYEKLRYLTIPNFIYSLLKSSFSQFNILFWHKKRKLQYVLTFLQDQDGENAVFFRDKSEPPPVFAGGATVSMVSVRAYTHGAFL